MPLPASVPPSAFLCLAVLLSPGPVSAGNPIEDRIREANPCAGIKYKAGGLIPVTIGVDKFKSASIEKAAITLQDGVLTFNLKGHLACRTSDAAVLKGDVSAQIAASARAGINNCDADGAVQLSGIGGTFAGALQPLVPAIQGRLQAAMLDEVRTLCNGLFKDDAGR